MKLKSYKIVLPDNAVITATETASKESISLAIGDHKINVPYAEWKELMGLEYSLFCNPVSEEMQEVE